MSQPPSKSRLDTALELLVYAPLGITLYMRDAYPMIRALLVNRGRTELEQRSSQMSSALTSWKQAGASALAQVPVPGRARATAGPPAGPPTRLPARPNPEPPPAGPAVEPAVRSAAPPPTPSANGRAGAAAPPAAALPIPGYDELSASQVVERLTGLAPAELEIVRRYELAGRGRKTILGRIEQLAS